LLRVLALHQHHFTAVDGSYQQPVSRRSLWDPRTGRYPPREKSSPDRHHVVCVRIWWAPLLFTLVITLAY